MVEPVSFSFFSERAGVFARSHDLRDTPHLAAIALATSIEAAVLFSYILNVWF